MERGHGGRGPSTSGLPPHSHACFRPLQSLYRPVLRLPSALCGHLQSWLWGQSRGAPVAAGLPDPRGKAHGALLSARRGGAQRAGLLPCLRGAPGMLPGLGSKLGPAEPPGGPSARDSAALPLPCVDWPPLPQKPPSRGGTSRPIQLPRRPGPSHLQGRPVLAWTAFPQLASKNILRWVWAWGRRGLWLGCRPLGPLTAQPHSPVGRRPQSRDITLQTQLPPNLSGRTGVSSAPQEHIAWVLGRLQTPSVTTGVTCGCLAPSPTRQRRTREAFVVKTGHPEV